MFQSRASLATLSTFCRSMSMLLNSGLPLVKAFDLAAEKSINPGLRRVLEAATRDIRNGSDVYTAFHNRGEYFPDLFLDMVHVGEQSGAVPEVLRALAVHYENMLRLRRSFIGAITFPILQLVAAIFIVAILIYVLGIVGSITGQRGQPVDMLGWGLIGAEGAVTWLFLSFGSMALIYVGYLMLSRSYQQQRYLDATLLAIPVVGACLRSFAIARFSWCFALTQQTGMPIARSLDASLRATGNGAFQAASPVVCSLVNSGESLSIALAEPRVFPEDYVRIVEVAETSGTVPETLERLSPEFEDQARRSLKIMADALGWVVWAIVAVLIIFVIFSIFSKYVGLINDAARGL